LDSPLFQIHRRKRFLRDDESCEGGKKMQKKKRGKGDTHTDTAKM